MATVVVVADTVPRLTPAEQHRTTDRVIQHHAFTPPLLRSYFGEGELQYWTTSGSTVITDHYVRLTPDRGGHVGHLWNTEVLDMPSFEIVVGFHVHGGRSGGADGFALWITTETPVINGPLLGRPMKFTGIGVIFDTYDNDGMRDNPAVYVLYNDGSNPGRQYHPQNDYKGEYVGSCQYNFRQSSQYPSTARLHYVGNVLQVYLSRTGEEDEVLCTTVVDVHLDTKNKEYYIGLSAETGGVTDNHDIIFVHTMPVEGEKYDHDVYDTTTSIEEADKHKNDKSQYERHLERERERQMQDELHQKYQEELHQQQRQERLKDQQHEGEQEQQHEKQEHHEEQQQQHHEKLSEQQQKDLQRQEEQLEELRQKYQEQIAQKQQQQQQQQQPSQEQQQQQQQQQQPSQEQQQQGPQQQQQPQQQEPQGEKQTRDQTQGASNEPKKTDGHPDESQGKQESQLSADQLRLRELERQLEEMRRRQRPARRDRRHARDDEEHEEEEQHYERKKYHDDDEEEEEEEDDHETIRKTVKKGTGKNRREPADDHAAEDERYNRDHDEEEDLDERRQRSTRRKRTRTSRPTRSRRPREE
ncbi:putative lectin [Trypanosoma theileri]|uniref:Putative lectin n=1 Tax=Trypanosoma theileri TaxID=67003 RepID=A0A1X0NNG4_9TRYP|nr:putative lectin [Trypanosoma theileri]ORC86141.1 putative lectin [Trypanosoma theileri]